MYESLTLKYEYDRMGLEVGYPLKGIFAQLGKLEAFDTRRVRGVLLLIIVGGA